MTEPHDIRALGPYELESFLEEIRRYLEAVELFRREGYEPGWRHEGGKKEALR
jgi:hypothetical protein